MKIEDIKENWDKDSEIDITNISSESANIPKIHNKYFNIYMKESLVLKKMRNDYKIFKHLKERYYRGELSQTELQENNWKPQPIKILKQDISTYVDADKELLDLDIKIEIQTQKVQYLDSIIKMINNRGYQLKTIVDFERFKAGLN